MNCNLKSIAAVALLHANVHVQQVLTQTPATQPTNPITGWMAVRGALGLVRSCGHRSAATLQKSIERH